MCCASMWQPACMLRCQENGAIVVMRLRECNLARGTLSGVRRFTQTDQDSLSKIIFAAWHFEGFQFHVNHVGAEDKTAWSSVWWVSFTSLPLTKVLVQRDLCCTPSPCNPRPMAGQGKVSHKPLVSPLKDVTPLSPHSVPPAVHGVASTWPLWPTCPKITEWFCSFSTGVTWTTPLQLAKNVDMGCVMGTGQNHLISTQHLEARMNVFKTLRGQNAATERTLTPRSVFWMRKWRSFWSGKIYIGQLQTYDSLLFSPTLGSRLLNSKIAGVDKTRKLTELWNFVCREPTFHFLTCGTQTTAGPENRLSSSEQKMFSSSEPHEYQLSS